MRWFGRQDGSCDFCYGGKEGVIYQGRGAICRRCARQIVSPLRWPGMPMRLPTLAWVKAMIGGDTRFGSALSAADVDAIIADALADHARREIERLARQAILDFDGYTPDELRAFYEAVGLTEAEAEAELARREAFEPARRPAPPPPPPSPERGG